MEEKFKQKVKQTLQPMDPWKKPGPAQAAVGQEQPVEFSLYSPQARSVSVAGTFNRWDPIAFGLKKDIQGTWRGSIRLKSGRYQYRFFVDGKWADDPKAKQTVPNEFGTKNAVLEVK